MNKSTDIIPEKKGTKKIEVDLQDKSAVKRMLDNIQKELFPKKEIKSIVLLKTSKHSKNVEQHFNYLSTSEFRIDENEESYALTESIYETDGIPVYMLEKDTHANIIMDFTDISEIKDKKEIKKYALKERLLTSSELYHIEDSTITKRIFPLAKFDFRMNMFLITIVLLSIIATSFIWYIIYNPMTGDLG